MPKALAKRSSDEKMQLKEAALLMRFHTTQPVYPALRYSSYKDIAKALRVSVNQAEHLCRYSPKLPDSTNKEIFEAKRLDNEQIAYITSDASLNSLAGKTLSERAKIFEVKFPKKKLSPARLRSIYYTNGIKKKKVLQLKLIP